MSKKFGMNKKKYMVIFEFFYLLDKQGGSVVKIDYFYGVFLMCNDRIGGKFKFFFLYGFYNNYLGYFNVSVENIEVYIDVGYIVVYLVFGGDLDFMIWFFDNMECFGFMFQYDMCYIWKN